MQSPKAHIFSKYIEKNPLKCICATCDCSVSPAASLHVLNTLNATSTVTAGWLNCI